MNVCFFSSVERKEEERPPSPEGPRPASPQSPAAPRRFISSILGGDVPYGSRGHVLTRAERKEYAPPAPPKPAPAAPVPATPAPARCQQVSVIQRTPAPAPSPPAAALGPEQDAPIDYHVPKKRAEDDEPAVGGGAEEKIRPRARVGLKQLPGGVKRGLLPPVRLLGWHLDAAGATPRSAAAGHNHSGRGGGGGGGGQGGGGGGGSGHGSSNLNYSGGGGGLGGGGGGGMLGGSGGGGGSMNPNGGGGGGGGRGGSNMYGPSSPPTASLPPFYESLKGGGLGLFGNNAGGGQQQFGGGGGGYSLLGPLPMDCDTGQQPPPQYSLLQNVCESYGITLKEEEDDDDDLSEYVAPKVEGVLPPPYAYDAADQMVVDMVSGGVVDPLQFTATLTFSGAADHNALIASLSDDLFLQRMSSPEESIPPPVEPSVDPFPEHCHGVPGFHHAAAAPTRSFGAPAQQQQQQGSDSYHNLPKERGELALHISSGSSSASSPPPGPMQQLQIQVQPAQQSQLLSPGLSFAGLDSPGAMSLPSPASCSLDDGNGSLSPPGSVSGRRDADNVPSLQVRVNILQQRLGLPGDVALEFVNGGHGIKNPLANHDPGPAPGRAASETRPADKAAPVNPDDPVRFTCRVCSKTFGLQRLLNRHMKCHSDVKRYLCTFCGKGFNDTFDLKRHTRTHTGRCLRIRLRSARCINRNATFTQAHFH